MHDLVIRNGVIVDGSGKPSVAGDIAVDGDRITAVGEVVGSGRREIEADGHVVTPGWVDIHTHYDAELFGFEDRGVLAPGYLADINVIDFDNLSLGTVEMSYDLPANGKRLTQRASGYTATIKSGVVVRDHDEATGERPGRLVRGPQSAPKQGVL